MTKEDERTLFALIGIYLLSQNEAEAPPGLISRLKDAGARLYDTLHDDENHKQDLPGPRILPEAILAIAQLVGFPDPKLASAIAMGESLGYINAKNITPREYSVGLWQINTKVHPYTPQQMADPLQNARAAFKISKGGTNWKPWGAYTNGRYKQFQKGVLA